MALSLTGRGVRRVACLWPACAALGCTPSKTESAEAPVRRLFAALPPAGCAGLGPLLATGGRAEPCPETVRELTSHGYALVEIVDSKVDGRDPNAVMVRARMTRGGVPREEPLVLRVEHQDGGWKLRL